MDKKEQTLDQLENSGTAAGSNIALDRADDKRFSHVDFDDERVIHFGDRKFEKVMMIVGIAIVITMFILMFVFYTTIEVREAETESLATQVERSFFGAYIGDKDYILTFRIDNQLFEYDPLENLVEEGGSSKGVSPVSSKSTGGYRVNPSDSSSIVDGSGRNVLTLGDPAVAIDTVLVAPNGGSVIFDTHPANTQAQEKWGLRLGAYELIIEEDRFETLISDASPGVNDPTYREHFVEILSISPDGRYVAFTNLSKLKLYDRLSGASVDITDLSSATLQPETGWSERPIDSAGA